MKHIERNYEIAKETFKEYGIDTDVVLEKMDMIPVSIHCWQLDDLHGFEGFDYELSGGIAVTGNAPCKVHDMTSYYAEMERVLSYIPGKNRIAIHAMYLDNEGKNIDRDEIEPHHFDRWIAFARKHGIGLDFNPSYFSHPKATDGFTLSSIHEDIRRFWIEHGKRSRRIGGYIGKQLKDTCYTNHWIPDGYKDTCADTLGPRLRLIEALDEIFAEDIDRHYNVDSLESKVFGLGSESYVTGSHEFYTNYVMNRKNSIICLDVGHYHPTESVAAKLSSYLAFGQEIMLHVSRPVRWDSDHVVILDEETENIMKEIKRANAFDKVHIGLDFFDGTLDRSAATILGARSAKLAIMKALLEPSMLLQEAELKEDFTKRITLMEEIKSLPYSYVWDMYCDRYKMPGNDLYESYIREV